MRRRVIALAGIAQAIEAVLQLAEHGHADERLLALALDSLFVTDPPSTEAVYGSLAQLRPGLQLLIAQLDGEGPRRASANRIAFALLQVERRLVASRPLMRTLDEGIDAIAPLHARDGSADHHVQQRLGELYARTISTLTPRVMVQVNPTLLAQPAIVGGIRAALLAAIRAAILWRQVGGSWWDLVLRRASLSACAHRLLEEASSTP